VTEKAVIPWWMAPMGRMDHLIPTCPALLKESKGNPLKGSYSVGDPYDYSVCGWCQRVYRARLRSS
jgi:hypothetical protein